jgi:hypothetical protein
MHPMPQQINQAVLLLPPVTAVNASGKHLCLYLHHGTASLTSMLPELLLASDTIASAAAIICFIFAALRWFCAGPLLTVNSISCTAVAEKHVDISSSSRLLLWFGSWPGTHSR